MKSARQCDGDFVGLVRVMAQGTPRTFSCTPKLQPHCGLVLVGAGELAHDFSVPMAHCSKTVRGSPCGYGHLYRNVDDEQWSASN